MERQARILEQRIEPLPVLRRRIEPHERVRGESEEGVEAQPDRRLRAERRRQRRARQPPLECIATPAPASREHGHPEQHRAFVIAPRARHLVDQRLHRMAVGRDEQHRHVAAHEQGDQQPERQQGQQPLHQRGPPQRGHQRTRQLPRSCRARRSALKPLARGATLCDRLRANGGSCGPRSAPCQHQLDERERRRQPQGREPRLGDHLSSVSVLCILPATCGGM
jgi:hypothetical protein